MPQSEYTQDFEIEDYGKQLVIDPRGPWTRVPAWAENRADLIESLPYFRQAQQGVYQFEMMIHGALIDGYGGVHTHFDDDIIITKLDGGGESSIDPHEKHASARLLAAQATKEAGMSVGLILGEIQGHPLSDAETELIFRLCQALGQEMRPSGWNLPTYADTLCSVNR